MQRAQADFPRLAALLTPRNLDFDFHQPDWQGLRFHWLCFWALRIGIIGDDIKSQVGATIVHRTLARLFEDRGVVIERTSQLNVGGNMDFKNMLERERLESKKISKTNAVTSVAGLEMEEKNAEQDNEELQ